MRVQGAVWVSISVFCLLAYQNFSGNGGVDSAPATSRVLKPVVHSATSAPAELAKPAIACPDDEKKVVYLSFKGARDGERITGTIEDSVHHVSLSIDVVLGRDSIVGDCASASPPDAGTVKLCFPHSAGPYFDAKLEGDRSRVEKSFAAAARCEAAQEFAVDLTL